MSAWGWLTAVVITENAEIVAVVEFNLRIPGCATHDSTAESRQGIHLVTNMPVGLKSRLFDDAPGTANVGIHKKETLIPVFDMGNAVSLRSKLVEGDARKHRKGQGLPFIAGRPPRQAKSRKAIEIPADSTIKR